MNKNNGILSEASKTAGMELDELDFYIVVVNGELTSAFIYEEDASGMVNNIIDSNTSDAIRESGREEEDLTDSEYREMVFQGGFDGDHAYYEEIYIDEDIDLEEKYTTNECDEFTYRDLLTAYNEIKDPDELFDELDEYETDDEEDNDDDDDDIF